MEHGIRIRTVILLWLLLSGVSGIQAQSAGDIDTLSQWRVDCQQANSYGVVYDHYKYYIEGDTIIDFNTYYKVYKSGYYFEWEFNGNISNNYYYDHKYAGALREWNNKWYTLNYYPGEDVLLYDFTMSVGDTLDSFATFGGTIIVIGIDTIMVNGIPKKRFHLEGAGWGNGEYIIEDIGATTGLFESLIFFENTSTLYCYAVDFNPLWINPEFGGCDLSVSVKEHRKSGTLSAYPNPFTTFTTIEYELTEPSHIQLTIYNAIGEMIYVAQEGIMQQGKYSFTWSPESLPEGMYYGVLSSEEGVSVVKMIKQ